MAPSTAEWGGSTCQSFNFFSVFFLFPSWAAVLILIPVDVYQMEIKTTNDSTAFPFRISIRNCLSRPAPSRPVTSSIAFSSTLVLVVAVNVFFWNSLKSDRRAKTSSKRNGHFSQLVEKCSFIRTTYDMHSRAPRLAQYSQKRTWEVSFSFSSVNNLAFCHWSTYVRVICKTKQEKQLQQQEQLISHGHRTCRLFSFFFCLFVLQWVESDESEPGKNSSSSKSTAVAAYRMEKWNAHVETYIPSPYTLMAIGDLLSFLPIAI